MTVKELFQLLGCEHTATDHDEAVRWALIELYLRRTQPMSTCYYAVCLKHRVAKVVITRYAGENWVFGLSSNDAYEEKSSIGGFIEAHVCCPLRLDSEPENYGNITIL
jgi:hypothetical protein